MENRSGDDLEAYSGRCLILYTFMWSNQALIISFADALPTDFKTASLGHSDTPPHPQRQDGFF